jgi:N-methylhydantoinase B
VRVGTPGGGGYGDPRERDPIVVAEDVRLGRYSAEQARTLFGVILTDGLEPDLEATAAARQ